LLYNRCRAQNRVRFITIASVAQSVEQLICNQWVVGSIPATSKCFFNMMPSPFPQFSKIDPSRIVQSLQTLLTQKSAALNQLLECLTKTLDPLQTVQQLEHLTDCVARFWAPIRHLNAVCETEALRQAYHTSLNLLTTWQTEIEQNSRVYQAILQFAGSIAFSHLDPVQKQLITYKLRNFRLAGVHLEEDFKKQYKIIKAQLAEWGAQFEANLLDAGAAGALTLTDRAQLAGLPLHLIKRAEKLAQEKGLKDAWILPLEGACYQIVLSTAADQTVRARFYRRWVTRASDNGPLLFKIVQQRQQLSQLLGFKQAAELSLATDKMAKTPEAVLAFLSQLIPPARTQALKELETLQAFAREQGYDKALQPWDLAYWSEKLKAKQLAINEEKLRPYFPITQVLTGLFALLNRLFQISIKQLAEEQDSWHPDVKIFAIYGSDQQLRGYFYLDLFARPYKRGGAWVDDCQQRHVTETGALQYPIAFVTCNFTAAQVDNPTLITHEEVVTLFHEMGHALHHTLTQVNYASLSGTQGVPWDAVEFPSQFLENFAWEPEVLKLISSHYQTEETLPTPICQALQESRHFQAGLQLLKQLELALFDFRLHLEFDLIKGPEQVQSLLETVREQTGIIPTPSFNRFQNGFSHIFADSYAAGYYSYLWAEVLAADAFEYFKAAGLFNPEIGKTFLNTILEQGGAVDALVLFQQFRGRSPQPQAFLKQRGILDLLRKKSIVINPL
jgi:oligopeptidase A